MITLEQLLYLVKNIVMTKEQRELQRRSFAYGNINISNSNISRDMIDIAAERLLEEQKDKSKKEE